MVSKKSHRWDHIKKKQFILPNSKIGCKALFINNSYKTGVNGSTQHYTTLNEVFTVGVSINVKKMYHYLAAIKS